jgi:hypothetical protein
MYPTLTAPNDFAFVPRKYGKHANSSHFPSSLFLLHAPGYALSTNNRLLISSFAHSNTLPKPLKYMPVFAQTMQSHWRLCEWHDQESMVLRRWGRKRIQPVTRISTAAQEQNGEDVASKRANQLREHGLAHASAPMRHPPRRLSKFSIQP